MLDQTTKNQKMEWVEIWRSYSA